MKKICIAGCLCLALLLLLPGCAGKRTLTSVRLSEVTHSVFYAPQYVAMSQGFFREEGLDVELTNGGGADKVMTAVVSGQADMGLAGPEAAIYINLFGKALSSQTYFCSGRLAPYLERACIRPETPWVSSVPRMMW